MGFSRTGGARLESIPRPQTKLPPAELRISEPFAGVHAPSHANNRETRGRDDRSENLRTKPREQTNENHENKITIKLTQEELKLRTALNENGPNVLRQILKFTEIVLRSPETMADYKKVSTITRSTQNLGAS